MLKNVKQVRKQWFTSVILAILEADIRRIVVESQSRKILCKTPISKITTAK
jgi:hypothetical protein